MMRILSKTQLCSTLAIATAMVIGARPAAAQVVGSPSDTGGATITGNGSSVVLNAPQTTISWDATGTPNNGVRDFLPSGSVMAFSSQTDFAVLNRVASGTDMIGLNGTITSTVGNGTGGTVFFYNPNGIVVGGNALIDVGSLGLTTSDPGSGSNWFNGFGGASPTLSFSGASNPASKVQIDSGARINSNGTDNFIAVVAPKIESSGTIKADGDVALVAAEAATLRFNGGNDLYAIEVSVGTGVTSNSIELRGGSIGRNAQVETTGIARNAYLVAVPKNTATTMLIADGASLGFDVANSVAVEGNSVILSAGRDLSLFGNGSGTGSIRIEDATFSSALEAFATGNIVINPTLGGTSILYGAELTAGTLIELDASTADIDIGASLLADVSADAGVDADAQAGTIRLKAGGGHTLNAAGDITIDASGEGGESSGLGDGGTGRGGTVEILAQGGTISAGSLGVDATGTGGGIGGNGAGGDGFGGTISVDVSGGGTLSSGYLWLTAAAEGGSNIECLADCGVTGGNARGGTIAMTLSGAGSALSSGDIYAYANAWGGSGDVTGGSGLGGTVSLTSSGGSLSAGYAYFDASGSGGYGLDIGDGGLGQGGSVTLTATRFAGVGTTINASQLWASADGDGGTSQYGNAGAGLGGSAIASLGGVQLTAGSLQIGADGEGGSASFGRAGFSQGGTAQLNLTDGATVDLAYGLYLDANGEPNIEAGSSATGAAGQGGTARLNIVNSTLNSNTSNQGYNTIDIAARGAGTGGNGAFDAGTGAGTGGTGIGGNAELLTSNAILTANQVSIEAAGRGGYSLQGNGGAAQGGSAQVVSNDGSLTAANVALLVGASGGDAGSGQAGGNAAGGRARYEMNGGGATLAGLTLQTTASGGSGGTQAGTAGLNQTQGTIDVALSGATVNLAAGSLYLDGEAYGGYGATSGVNGGDARGSDITMTVTNSTLTAGALEASGAGYGGGANSNARGGAGTGGKLITVLGGGAQLQLSDMLGLDAQGHGGSSECTDCGAAGGDGFGGRADLVTFGNGNALNAASWAYVYASGIGGDGETGGGNGTGGATFIGLSNDTTMSFGQFYSFADGVGGEAFGVGNGGRGQAGAVGLATSGFGSRITMASTNSFHLTAEGYGGNANIGNAGDGISGTVNADFTGLTFNAGASGLWLSTIARGGNALAGSGGAGRGGTNSINFGVGSSINTARDINSVAYAIGGDGLAGGEATGGTSNVTVAGTIASGSAMTSADRSFAIISTATGGNGSAGSGGNAVGGNANLTVNAGGSLSATQLHQKAWALGGSGAGAGNSGGSASAGSSVMSVMAGGSVATNGRLFFDNAAVGGAGSGGADGGDALSGGMAFLDILGTLAVTGDLDLTVDREGGAGRNGGDALASIDYASPAVGTVHPVAEVLSNGGNVSVTGTTRLYAQGTGGTGELGGTGGDAFGGVASLRLVNNAAAPSRINLGETVLLATATGGRGGDGLSVGAGTGGDGGNGGNALGGLIYAQAYSLDGQLTTGNLTASTVALAGDGGSGGQGDNGGKGGKGGSVAVNINAGSINLGTVSGNNVAGLTTTSGFAHYGNISLDTSATGGNGGWGGYAYSGVDGTGGDGGLAESGDVYFLNRGGDVTAASVLARFDAKGGWGGYSPSETPSGAGGDAIIGGVNFANTNRNLEPANRGSMTLGNVDLAGTSIGGYGLTSGGSYHDTGFVLDALNSDTQIANFSFQAEAADGAYFPGQAFVSSLAAQNGSLSIAGNLSIVTPGPMSVWAESGVISASSILLDANNFVHRAGGPPTSAGFIDTGTLSIATGGDIVIDADLFVDAGLDLAAPGSISIGSASSAGGGLTLTADSGLILTRTLSAAGDVNLVAAGDIATLDVSSGGDLWIDGADISTGDLTALGDIDLTGSGSVRTADLTAQRSVTVVGGGIDAGHVIAGANLGGIGTFGFGAGESIGLWSGSTVDALSLTATGSIGVAAPGAISVGAISAGELVMLLGGSSILTGTIGAGDELYIAGYDMFGLGYDPVTEEFDPTPILAAAQTATGGPVTIGGDASATQIRAASSGFTAGALTATTGAVIATTTGGAIATGPITSAGHTYLEGGDITAGDIDAGGFAEVQGSGTTSVGSVTANQNVSLFGKAGLSAGFATSRTSGVDLTSEGAINSAGASADGIFVLANGAVNATGALTSRGDLRIDAANANLADLSATGTLGVASGGGINFANASAGSDLWMAGASGINGQNITSGGNALLFSAGSIGATSINAGGNVGIGGMDAFSLTGLFGSVPASAFIEIQGAGPGGAATVGSIRAANTSIRSSAVTIGDLTSTQAEISAPGLIRATGAWRTNYAELTSSDIDIAAGASITASSAYLQSTNSIGAGLGDNSGAAAGSYMLSNAEVGRISTDTLLILADMNASPIDLLIGDLTLAGGSGQYYDFGVINPNVDYDGRLRVVGKVVGQNFADGDRLDLDAQLIEIDAVNGGIDFSPNSDAAVGTLAFYGQRVHIAEGAVLDRLAANTQYANRDFDLATAPTAPHAATTINVGDIALYLFEPTPGLGGSGPTYSIYSQNMGSSGVRSGLLIAGADIISTVPNGSVEMIINGQLTTPAGTLQGAAVRDAYVQDPESNLALFTASSSINGCALTGSACSTPLPPPPPPPPLPPPEAATPDLANTLVFLDTSIGDMLTFGDEFSIGDGDAEENGEAEGEEKGAIEGPRMVINGKPIDPQTPTDEPVSGSGNPALIGTGSNQQGEQ